MHLCKMYLIDDRSNAHIIEADLFGTIEALQKIATHSPRPPDGMVHLMEMIKMSSERLEQSLAMSGKIDVFLLLQRICWVSFEISLAFL